MTKTPMSEEFRVRALTECSILQQLEDQLQPAITGLRYFYSDDTTELTNGMEDKLIPKLEQLLPEARKVSSVSELISFHKGLSELYDSYNRLTQHLKKTTILARPEITDEDIQQFQAVVILDSTLYGCYMYLKHYI